MRDDPTRIGIASGRSGLFVLLITALFAVAVFQAGVLEPWLQRRVTLRVLLPEAALAGLGRGSAVQLFGTNVGEVRALVIRPDQPFYAEVDLDEDAIPFIRTDSRVLIRRQFGIAGAAFLDITRGTGAELDWEFAVLEAQTERAPTDSIGELIDELQVRVFPLIEQATLTIQVAGDLLRSLAEPTSDLQTTIAEARQLIVGLREGEGTAGRLLTDQSLLLGLEEAVALVNARIGELEPVLADLQRFSANAAVLSGDAAGATAQLPALIQSVQRTLGTLDRTLRSVATLTEPVGAAAESASRTAAELPAVLVRVSQTLAQLEELLDTLRRSWLLGGGPTPAPGPRDVRP